MAIARWAVRAGTSCWRLIEDGEVDTVILAITDMQGRLQGKRVDAAFFADEVAAAASSRAAATCSPPTSTCAPSTASRSPRGSAATGTSPSSRTSRRSASCPGSTRRSSSSPTSRPSDGEPVAPSPRQVLQRQVRAPRRARLARAHRHRARVHRLQRHLRGRVGLGLSRHDPGQPVQRRLLAPGHVARRAAARPDPPRRCATPAWWSSRSRASATSASTRSPSSTPRSSTSATSTASTSSAPRRSPPRRATASRSWPSTTSARATRATSTSRCATRTDHAGLRRRRRARLLEGLRALPRGQLELRARALLLPRAQHQQLQALRRGLLRADRAALGHRQPHVRLSRRRPRPVDPRRVPDPGRRRQPVPRAVGAGGRGAARRRGGPAPARRPSRGNAYAADAARVPTTLHEAIDLFDASEVARDAFGDEVVDHYVHAARVEVDGVRRGRHRLGTLPRIRAAVSSYDRHQPGDRGGGHARSRLVDVDETDRAIERAAAAGAAWRRVTPADRARLLRRFADVVDAHIEELARLEVANSGHTIANARWEAGNVRDVLDLLLRRARAPRRASRSPSPAASTSPSTSPSASSASSCPGTSRCPSPAGASAPALAAGNTVVLKPATLDAADRDAPGRARARGRASPRASSRSSPATGRRSASAS